MNQKITLPKQTAHGSHERQRRGVVDGGRGNGGGVEKGLRGGTGDGGGEVWGQGLTGDGPYALGGYSRGNMTCSLCMACVTTVIVLPIGNIDIDVNWGATIQLQIYTLKCKT